MHGLLAWRSLNTKMPRSWGRSARVAPGPGTAAWSPAACKHRGLAGLAATTGLLLRLVWIEAVWKRPMRWFGQTLHSGQHYETEFSSIHGRPATCHPTPGNRAFDPDAKVCSEPKVPDAAHGTNVRSSERGQNMSKSKAVSPRVYGTRLLRSRVTMQWVTKTTVFDHMCLGKPN